jgi:hypothetical protein
MIVTSDFTYTEGKWTNEKRRRAYREISERCQRIGNLDTVAVKCEEPIALATPGNGPVVFRYRAYVEFPD